MGNFTKRLSIERGVGRCLGMGRGGGEEGKIHFNSLSIIIGCIKLR